MAKFSVNAQRFDPYKSFRFRVKCDGRYVAGVSKVTVELPDLFGPVIAGGRHNRPENRTQAGTS